MNISKRVYYRNFLFFIIVTGALVFIGALVINKKIFHFAIVNKICTCALTIEIAVIIIACVLILLKNKGIKNYISKVILFSSIESNLISIGAYSKREDKTFVELPKIKIEKELRKLAPKKTKANSKNTKAKNENTNAQSGNDDKGENKTCDYSDTPSKSALEAVENNNSETLEATNVGTFTIDPETGEVLELSRDYDGLRRSWKLQCEYAKSSACWRLTRFCTCTVDTKPTYSELNTIVAAFCKWLTRNYTDLLDNCFIFLEPCDDGSWHVHFLIAMIDKPLTFDDEVKIKEWWARKNTKPCDDQVQFAEPFESVDDLLRVLDYLNPTSKKKRHRIKNYPQSCQPMRHIGNVVEPNKALTKFEIAKTILREEKTERRNAIEIEQTNTGVLLYSCKEYLFVAAQNLLKATQAGGSISLCSTP